MEVLFILFLALLTSLQAFSVEVFLAVTGALSGFTVAYILPSLFYLKISTERSPLKNWAKLLLLVSVILAILSVIAILRTPNVKDEAQMANILPTETSIKNPADVRIEQEAAAAIAAAVAAQDAWIISEPSFSPNEALKSEGAPDEKKEQKESPGLLKNNKPPPPNQNFTNPDLVIAVVNDNDEIKENPYIAHLLPDTGAKNEEGDILLYEHNQASLEKVISLEKSNTAKEQRANLTTDDNLHNPVNIEKREDESLKENRSESESAKEINRSVREILESAQNMITDDSNSLQSQDKNEKDLVKKDEGNESERPAIQSED